MSLQVEQLNSEIETKTKDNVFVQVKLAVQYKVGAGDQQVQDAYYKLDDPEVQMQSYAFDVVRSHIPSMDLDEAYADADTIAMHIQETLHRNMADYGYEIVKALITNIEPDQRVKDAMNNINASQRNQIAAAAQGDAQKTLAVKKAEGEKETMRLQGEGVAAERKAIAEGLKESLEIIAEQGLDPKEAMALVALTQYTDMIRALGEGSQTNTILLPHSPSGVGDLMAQIRDGFLVADAAAEAGGRVRRGASPPVADHAESGAVASDHDVRLARGEAPGHAVRRPRPWHAHRGRHLGGDARDPPRPARGRRQLQGGQELHQRGQGAGARRGRHRPAQPRPAGGEDRLRRADRS